MYIQFFNFMIAITDNGKNILFLFLILYSIFITTLYSKSKLDSAAMKTYYEDLIIDLKENCKSDAKETKIQLYEEYLKEKSKLLQEFKSEAKQSLPEDYYIDVSLYDKETNTTK